MVNSTVNSGMLNNENYVRLRAAKAFPDMTLALCLTKMYAYRKGCEAKNRDLPDEGWLTADFSAGILRTHPIMLSRRADSIISVH